MAQVYVWGKYNLNVKYEEDHSAQDPKQGDINNFWVGKSYSFSAVNGKYTLNNALEMSRENDAAQYPYAIDGAMTGGGVYYAEEAYGINKTAGWISSSGKLAYRIPDTLSGKIFYPVCYGVKTIKEKGAYIEDVTSESENTYPKDGIGGNYYYVFKYAVPSVPSITVPGAAMIGHAVDISWEAADSAESYKLERRVDSGGWTQVYAGDGLTYTDTAQSGWTSVQYRISAGISGVYGGLTVSNVVSIIPVSSLVISGTDGNLGTAKAPVTYSVTSDTDSPITVTEIINGHERTLTPASGQTITIPVSMLDPGAGAITIKASVQAASGIVNQTRNWTYTKTPLVLPVDPYRVEQMQGKECDIFPQTLAEAVMMPDGSSVAGPGIGRNVIRSYPVASGQSIQAGDVVDVVEGQLQKTVTAVPNVNTVVNKTAYAELQMVHLSKDINVQIYMNSSGGTMYANILDDNGGIVLKGQNIGMDMENIAAARLDDTHVLVGFVLSGQLSVMVGTVSGKTISFGDSVDVDGTFDRFYSFAALPNGRVAVVYKALVAGPSKLRMRVFKLSSSSFGSVYTRDVTGESQIYISAAAISEERVCICFADQNDSSKGKAVVAAINGSNVVTWGEVVTFEDVAIADEGLCCTADNNGDIYVIYTTGQSRRIRFLETSDALSPSATYYDIGISGGTTSDVLAITNVGGVIVYGRSNYAGTVSYAEGNYNAGKKYMFNNAASQFLQFAAISSNRLIAAYADLGNSKYGTVTTLTVSGNQIAGSFVDGSQDAIALQSGTAGQSIEVIYSGTVAADWVTEGQVITSPGVYGAGVLAGVLQVWSKERPGQAVTGRYVGTGAYGRDNPNSLTFPQPPKMVVCVQEFSDYAGGDNYGFTWVGNIGGTAQGTKIFSLSGNTLSWYNDSEAKQANQKGRTYYYTAIF